MQRRKRVLRGRAPNAEPAADRSTIRREKTDVVRKGVMATPTVAVGRVNWLRQWNKKRVEGSKMSENTHWSLRRRSSQPSFLPVIQHRPRDKALPSTSSLWSVALLRELVEIDPTNRKQQDTRLPSASTLHDQNTIQIHGRETKRLIVHPLPLGISY